MQPGPTADEFVVAATYSHKDGFFRIHTVEMISVRTMRSICRILSGEVQDEQFRTARGRMVVPTRGGENLLEYDLESSPADSRRSDWSTTDPAVRDE
jgi:hypothetical protein